MKQFTIIVAAILTAAAVIGFFVWVIVDNREHDRAMKRADESIEDTR